MALSLSTRPVLGLPPELPASLSDTEVETAGGDSHSLGSTELETWPGELMMMTEERGAVLAWGGDEAGPLDHIPRGWGRGGAGVDPPNRHVKVVFLGVELVPLLPGA